MAEPDNALMLEILKDIRKDVAGIRQEQDNHRTLLLTTVDNLRRLQRLTEQKFLEVDNRFNGVDKRFLDMQEHMKAHKDDLEMMLKAELLGAMSNYRIKIENYVHERLSEKDE